MAKRFVKRFFTRAYYIIQIAQQDACKHSNNHGQCCCLEKPSNRPESAMLQLQHKGDDAVAKRRPRDLCLQRLWTLQKATQGTPTSPFTKKTSLMPISTNLSDADRNIRLGTR